LVVRKNASQLSAMALRRKNRLSVKGTLIALICVQFVREHRGRRLWADLPEAASAAEQATIR
jgi:hypothetical protein